MHSEAQFTRSGYPLKRLTFLSILKAVYKTHALFMDVTHDNETPTMKRTTEDAITMGALVAFSWSAIGSTKGFDDLYPKTLDVVQENRLYRPISNPEESGIGAVKRLVNHLHVEMVRNGYSEGHDHQENDYLVMHRAHPQTHRGFVCLSHTAFHKGSKDRGQAGRPQRERPAHFCNLQEPRSGSLAPHPVRTVLLHIERRLHL